ncbi:MAG TPA: protoporphyrinogen oxidase [Candidatus Acidoferrum sp.]|jgi:oxygen-dependent protoporphyrinogen oxidase|nr:protoporphyrinogen oxidase [Candidatus Acidoferrum sp.]
MADPRQAVVIGGGISGLACAYRLRQLGVPVTLLEASPRPGGLIESVETNGFRFETGPQSFLGTPPLMQLIRELKIEGELVTANPRAPRYILRHGRLQKIGLSPQAMLSSSFLSPGSRWKLASEAFRRTVPPSEEETIAAFVRRKFGHEILEYLVSPFVSGVYAGDPEKLSLRAAFPSLEEWEREYGSVIRGAMKSRKQSGGVGPSPLCSFRRGAAALPGAMAEFLGGNAKVLTPVSAITRTASGYQVRVAENAQHTIASSAVILAAPAYAASGMVRPFASALADTLSGIAYASVAVFSAGYHAKQLNAPLDGFGVLIPRSEKHRTLGIVFNSSLFAGRAPEGQLAITSFLGGATDPELLEESDDRIAAIAEKDSAAILGISGQPIASAVWRHPKALPQYNLGHAHIVGSLRDAERRHPGLFFSGNYLEGPSIGKCVEHSFKTAQAARDYLNSSPE